MAKKTQQPLTIAPSAQQLLAMDRHTDWAVAHEGGRLRNGRPYIAGGFQGSHRTKRALQKKVCRGRVRYG